MSLLFAFLFLSSPAEAAFLPRYEYALDCPGAATLVSSYRHDWAATGDVISPRFDTLEKENAFYYERVRARSLGVINTYFGPSSFYVLGPLMESIDWRTGVYIPVDGLDLPAEIDGCRVVPILARIPSFQGSQKKNYGAEDSFKRLAPIDQLLILYVSSGISPDLLRAVMSDSFEALNPQQRAGLFYSLGWPGFQYRGLELRNDCQWSEAGNPSSCVGALEKSLVGNQNPVIFYPNGAIHSYIKAVDEEVVPLDLSQPNLVVPCWNRATVTYGSDGYLRFCGGRLYGADHQLVFGNYKGEAIKGHFYAALKGDAVFGEGATLRYATVSWEGNNGFRGGPLQKFKILSHSTIELYSDGAFKAGNVQFDDNKLAYIEATPEGGLARKADNMEMTTEFIENSEDQEKYFYLEGTWDLLELGDGCPAPKKESGGLTLAPRCVALVKIMRRTQ